VEGETEMEYLTEAPIELNRWHQDLGGPCDGASVEFVGIVRALEDKDRIAGLEYEAYVPMAESVIERLTEEAKRLWPLNKVVVRHRIGKVPVGEAAVFVGVVASHREEAFAACRFLIDRIKSEAPIWKKALRPSDAERSYPVT